MNETTELIMKQLNSKKVHAETHEVGGGDEIDVTKLKNIEDYVTIDGDFAGTWNGVAMTSVEPGLSSAFNALKADTVTRAEWIDGIDDTTSVQNAMNLASTTNHYVKLRPGKVYVVTSLTPIANVILDLNGSTLKLKNGTGVATSENPLFNETSVKATHSKQFAVINGTLDGNNANNHAGNTSGGIIWLRNWDNIRFEDLTITNAFRVIFNILGCNNVTFKNINCTNNGLNSGGFYSYGASFEESSKNITIDNFKIDTMYGYGMHFYTAENAKVSNLDFSALTKGGLSIGVTITGASRIEVSNVKMLNVDGDNFEVNNSNTVNVDNMEITNAGNRSVLFGNMTSGINSKNVKISNLKTVNSGNTYAMAINYVDSLSFENCTIDKIISTLPGTPSSNITFHDCVMPFNLDASFLYDRYNHFNSQFNDRNLHKNKSIVELSNVGEILAAAAVSNLNLGAFLGPKPNWAGELTVLSQFTGSTNQGTIAKYLLFLSNGTMNISASTASQDGSLARKVAVTVDTVNKYIVFTNSTGVEVSLRYTLKCF